MASAAKYRRIARHDAAAEGINPTLFERQINAESNFTTGEVSGAGATGIAQFEPQTARSLGIDPNNPRQALKGAAHLMARYLHTYHGDWRKALTAYNAGPGRVGGPLPAETQAYIQKIVGAGSGRQSAPSGGGDSGGAATPVFKPATVQLGQQTTFDQQGFDQARKGAILGQLIARNEGTGGPLFKAGLLSTSMPSPADFQRTQLTSKVVGGQQIGTIGGGGGAGGSSVQAMLARAEKVNAAHPAYLWGGGHGAAPAKLGDQVDCSGFVSQVLGVTPRVSGDFMRFGEAGRGRQVTVWANSGHVLVEIAGRWYATSHSNPGGGAGRIAPPSKQYLAAFTPRHPRGL